MPESVLFDQVLPKYQMTVEHWFTLIRERASMVHKFMDRAKLDRLNDFIYDASHGRTINNSMYSGTVVNKDAGLPSIRNPNLEGIFRVVKHPLQKPHEHFVLCFARHGKWVMARIAETSWEGRQVVQEVELFPTDLDVIKHYGMDERQMLAFLTDGFKSWVETRRAFLNRMEQAQREFELEDRIVGSFSPTPLRKS